jgi:hypothetical protein
MDEMTDIELDPGADEAAAGYELDSDLDGTLDSLAVDADGDGYSETLYYDSDADGTYDVVSVDGDGDGYADMSAIDVDADGDVDTVAEDTDADGMVDTVADDTDGDGILESLAADRDGDGLTEWFGTDTDGDGVADEEHTVDDPTATAEGGVHGGSETEWYQEQAIAGQCVPTSVAMIVSEHTGEWIDFEDAVATADDLELLAGGEDSPKGMWAQQAEALLEHYGVEAHVEHGDIEALSDHLDDGHGVIAIIDANEIWDMPDGPGTNHALVVTGVDEEAGTVTLNDPGQPDGGGIEVPIDEFMDAWSDGGNQMVVTDDPASGFDAPDPDEPFTDEPEVDEPDGDELVLIDMAASEPASLGNDELGFGGMAVGSPGS